MLSTLILFGVVVIGIVFFKLQEGDNPKIPPTSSPKGKKTRIASGILVVIAVGALIFSTMSGGLSGDEASKRLTFQSIIIATIVVLIPLLIRWKMKGRGK